MLLQKLLAIALISTEWIIWVLLLLSVISVAVIIERFFVLRLKRGDLQLLKQRIGAAMRKANNAGIESILRQDNSSAAKILLETIQNTKSMGLDFEDSLAIAISEEKLRLESRIAILGTLGNNAPFIGLFGTVLGIINAFHSLAQNTKGGPTIIMTGISEALIATALGLFIAIPAVGAYNYFIRRIKKIIVSAENFTRMLTPVCMAKEKERS
ncbi:MAG: MotA/TolQ/ExbB proton channel family protein [Candidatus Omnitrophota bacterium]|nr:MotA/TolQ/ExbB proton channel family protein [Candidatus Omnitrophota bacterium]